MPARRGNSTVKVLLEAGNNVAWWRKSKVGEVGRVVTRSQRKEKARLHSTLWAIVRILDFIPSVIESLWRVLTGEQHDLAHIFKRSLSYVEK